MCKAESETTIMNGSGVDKAKADKEIPAIANTWRNVYLSVPKVYAPFSKTLDISFMVASALFMTTVRISIEKLQLNFFDWPSDAEGIKVTQEAASILAAIVHSSLLVPGLYAAITSQKYCPSEHLSVSPRWWQDVTSALLQFCTGYMLYDTFYGILWTKWDSTLGMPVLDSADHMYLGHHFATIFYMTTTRILNAGHQSAMMCMFLGELTNPVFNTYGLLKLIKDHNLTDCCMGGPLSTTAQAIVDLAFPLMFFTARAIFAPTVLGLYTSGDLLFSIKARQFIPFVIRILFVIMIWGVIVGSIPWITECWDMLQQYFGFTITTMSSGKEL